MNHPPIPDSPTNRLMQSSNPWPKLLVSVRDVAEIEDAIAGGADWIDFKEPREGALGAVSFEQACCMVQAVAHRRPISAALGELLDWNNSPAQQLLEVPGIDVVKLGLAGCALRSDWQTTWQTLFQQAADQDKQLAAVIYADYSLAEAPDPDTVLELAIKSGTRYLLIDTWDKRSQSTLDCFLSGEVERIVNIARNSELQIVLAGKLQLADLPSIVKLATDLVAVRGAACEGLRTDKINQQAVWAIKMAISSAR